MAAKRLERLGALLILGLVSAGLAGCASGAAAPTPGAPPTQAQAVSFAHAVNLQPSDIPGILESAPEAENERNRPLDRELALCVGSAAPDNAVASVHSATFRYAPEGRFVQLQSRVEVQPDARVASLDYEAIVRRRGFNCLARYLPASIEKHDGSGYDYGALNITRLPTPLPGIPKSFGFRLTTSITSPGIPQPVPLYADERGLVSGPAEIMLTAVAAPEPLANETEQRLMQLLSQRAQQHKLSSP